MKPYSNNIIFFDTEFSSFNLEQGKILSLGFIKFNGEELYLELEFKGKADKWPEDNILPNLLQDKITREEAIKAIKDFIGNSKPYIVGYINQFDMAYFYSFFGLDDFNSKFNWIPIDFASILFNLGINPEILVERKEEFFNSIEIDTSKYAQHHALEDARILRDTYLKLLDEKYLQIWKNKK
jgi:hypothetical protein